MSSFVYGNSSPLVFSDASGLVVVSAVGFSDGSYIITEVSLASPLAPGKTTHRRVEGGGGGGSNGGTGGVPIGGESTGNNGGFPGSSNGGIGGDFRGGSSSGGASGNSGRLNGLTKTGQNTDGLNPSNNLFQPSGEGTSEAGLYQGPTNEKKRHIDAARGRAQANRGPTGNKSSSSEFGFSYDELSPFNKDVYNLAQNRGVNGRTQPAYNPPPTKTQTPAALPRSSGRGFNSFEALKRALGRAGDGLQWHHIVEQNPANIAKFGTQVINNTNNVLRIQGGAGSIHAKVSGYYSSKQPFTNGYTVRQWLNSQSYEAQYQFGIQTMKKFGWKP